ncbi:MAG: hypothetical protein QM777_15185 [Pseudorhodoferax sp.]
MSMNGPHIQYATDGTRLGLRISKMIVSAMTERLTKAPKPPSGPSLVSSNRLFVPPRRTMIANSNALGLIASVKPSTISKGSAARITGLELARSPMTVTRMPVPMHNAASASNAPRWSVHCCAPVDRKCVNEAVQPTGCLDASGKGPKDGMEDLDAWLVKTR